MSEVLVVLNHTKPHVFFVSESNLWHAHDREEVEIEGYKLLTTKMLNNKDRHVSRIVGYVKSDLIYRCRSDLEQEDFSSIWIEVGLRHQRKFLLAGVYREWNHLQTNEDHEDHSSRLEQESR